mmetsp:Transcript_56997/g.113240  ORF Transcript_56997/g.113240 Transcript_56997/m.113240 type:complete len:206 (-) Transcript_56997:126-743(-)|eukprot:CAMPEP_0174737708 /NCGR_PEP_ID=MMETSP1094-20130205/68754_1 /TAXON_ID=156173 /ORGANISM="Chrysochromulina brevifilum, Strain UTEX LB 985" /LENGTH=205 /DNA_ID=CAMNT_0015940981 /DNA_START=131 /DNA_END=748 /DNA_ORIENTATION=-
MSSVQQHIAIPGEVLPLATAVTPSTFSWGGQLRASVPGFVDVDTGGLQGHRSRGAVLTVGDMIFGRVMRINPRLATVDILCVGDTALREPCTGLLRREDVRPPDAGGSGAEMYHCFRPGDVVLAVVLSLGDARAYYLSTAANECGVVLSRTSEGVRMVPVSWCEMEDPTTKVREKRKVAKPPPATISATASSSEQQPQSQHQRTG